MLPRAFNGAAGAVRRRTGDLRLRTLLPKELLHTDYRAPPLHHPHHELLPLQRLTTPRRHRNVRTRSELALPPAPADMHQRTDRIEAAEAADDQDRAPVHDDSGVRVLPVVRGAVRGAVLGDVRVAELDVADREGDGAGVWGADLLFFQRVVDCGGGVESCFFEEVVVSSACEADIVVDGGSRVV